MNCNHIGKSHLPVLFTIALVESGGFDAIMKCLVARSGQRVSWHGGTASRRKSRREGVLF